MNKEQYSKVFECLNKLRIEASENIKDHIKEETSLLRARLYDSYGNISDLSEEDPDYEKKLIIEADRKIHALRNELEECYYQMEQLRLQLVEKNTNTNITINTDANTNAKTIDSEDEVGEDGMPFVFHVDENEYKLEAKDKNIRYLICLMAKKAFAKEKLGKEEYELLQYILKMSGYKSIETNYNKIIKNLETGSGNGGLLPKEKDTFEALRKKYGL